MSDTYCVYVSAVGTKWKPHPKRRAAVIPIFGPYQPIVRLNNGARDGQPHTHALRLAGEERFEDCF